MIIGAPAEDTSKYQRDVQRGGAVFKCDIRENNQCIMIPFDRNGKLFGSIIYVFYLLAYFYYLSLCAVVCYYLTNIHGILFSVDIRTTYKLLRDTHRFDNSQDHPLNFNETHHSLYLPLHYIFVHPSSLSPFS